jgi:hypothetical protein
MKGSYAGWRGVGAAAELWPRGVRPPPASRYSRQDSQTVQVSSRLQGLRANLNPRLNAFWINFSRFLAMLRIRDVYPGSEFFPSRIRIKEFKYFNSRIRILIFYPSRIRILIFYPSRIQDPGVKKAPEPGSGTLVLVTFFPVVLDRGSGSQFLCGSGIGL